MIKYSMEEKYEIWVGQNAQDNWNILNQSQQNYIWMHLDKFSSPYVIITTNDVNSKDLLFEIN